MELVWHGELVNATGWSHTAGLCCRVVVCERSPPAGIETMSVLLTGGDGGPGKAKRVNIVVGDSAGAIHVYDLQPLIKEQRTWWTAVDSFMRSLLKGGRAPSVPIAWNRDSRPC